MRFPISTVIVLLLIFALTGRGRAEEERDSVLEGIILTLDQFMQAGRDANPGRGARLLDIYESSPRKTERGIRTFYKDHPNVFGRFVSISKDIYGYEIVTKGYRWPNVKIEGGVETEGGITAEFEARLVFRDERWRIISLDID